MRVVLSDFIMFTGTERGMIARMNDFCKGKFTPFQGKAHAKLDLLFF